MCENALFRRTWHELISNVAFNHQIKDQSSEEFSPSVSLRCDRVSMYVSVSTTQPFYGVIHTRDHPKAPCIVQGNGSLNTTLRISLLATPSDELYCGIVKLKVCNQEDLTFVILTTIHRFIHFKSLLNFSF